MPCQPVTRCFLFSPLGFRERQLPHKPHALRLCASSHEPSHDCTDNAAFYISNGVPFVMGTTGGNREKLLADVQTAGIHAVIAPQMGKQARAASRLRADLPHHETGRNTCRIRESSPVMRQVRQVLPARAHPGIGPMWHA